MIDFNDKRVIPFCIPDISDKEIKEVVDTLKSGWITTGPKTKKFEKALADYSGTSKFACLNSATAALELSLRICGIGEGDEVIVPSFTYTASVSPVCHCGAKIIFVDTKKDSFEMDYESIADLINEKTKAIIGVDIAGIIIDYDKLFEIAESKKSVFKPLKGNSLGAKIQQKLGRIIIFADSAHALGATRNGKKAGQIADFTDFSFHAVKNFTTAEGGAATWRDIDGVDNEEIYRRFQLYSLHGQSKDALSKFRLGTWEYDIVGAWYKCNMTDITASIGLAQLERYDDLMRRRREIIKRYDQMCDELGIYHLNHYGTDFESSGHLYTVRIPGIKDQTRRIIMDRLSDKGISTNVHYKPLPMMTAYKNLGWDIKDFPNAYSYYENLITLPLHTKLSDDDVSYIIYHSSKIFNSIIKG